MTSPKDASPAREHPIVTGLGWFIATLAMILTGIAVWMIATVIGDWSIYEGDQPRVALVLLGFAALITLMAWGLTWIIFSSRRR